MVSVRPDSEAIPKMPVAKPKYAVILLNLDYARCLTRRYPTEA